VIHNRDVSEEERTQEMGEDRTSHLCMLARFLREIIGENP